MQRYKLNDLLKFVRDSDSKGQYKELSNNHIRTYLYESLKKNCLYFVHSGEQLIGFIEWYRVSNWDSFVRNIAQSPHAKSDRFGKFIWLQSIVFKKGTLNKGVFKQFLGFHKDIHNYFRFDYKQKKFIYKKF